MLCILSVLHITPLVYYLPSPRCAQAFHWHGRFQVLQLGLEGPSGQVRVIEGVVLGVFGDETWFLCFIVNLRREMGTVMPPVKKAHEVRLVTFLGRTQPVQ